MKKYLLLILFLVLCALLAVNGLISKKEFYEDSLEAQGYSNGLLNSVSEEYISTAKYDIKAILENDINKIRVKEKILWYNKTEYGTNKLFFHLYLNGYSGNHTIFSKRYPVDAETSTRIEIERLSIDSETVSFNYFSENPEYPEDSTVAFISLPKDILTGDSVFIEIAYSFKVPKSLKRLGYAAGRNFYFISQWYPKLGVFENGRWNCSSFYPNTNFYSDFADYEVELSVPAGYKVASTGVVMKSVTQEDREIYSVIQNAVHDFAWMASDEIESYSTTFYRNDSSQVVIKLFLQPEHAKYMERYFDAIKYGMKYFEDNIGSYPYETLTCIDPPRTSQAGGMEYPTLFTVRSELFSRKKNLRIESIALHEFIHQYFQGMVANDEVHEAWLDEGITTFLTSKLLYEKYGPQYSTFRFLDYISIEGINFLQYNEIPLIYTLGDFALEKGYNSFVNYYKSKAIGAIADASNEILRVNAYYNNAYHKPEMMLMSLEKRIGQKVMMQIIKKFFEEYKFKHPKGSDFIRLAEEMSNENLSWFWDAFYKENRSFDYGITDVREIKNNVYEVDVERFLGGIVRTDIALITETDTLYKSWDGKDRFKIIRFETDKKVLGAEVDPLRLNLFDHDFSNNSFTMERKYGASLSFSMRWFFWIQNVLTILGSIA
ncbi:MAG: M1 family metallopeptidase [Bacteroidetes bacterium]|nr:M1 family metallopeptidase [Bacteroidota bacterium]